MRLSPRNHCCACLLIAASCAIAAAARGDDGSAPLRTVIDREVAAAWARDKKVQSDAQAPAPADDAAFLRRLYLDLLGTIPTHDEAKRFLGDPDPAKRQALIDRLLDDPRYAARQAMVWDLVLFGRNPLNAEAVRKRDLFRGWLTQKFAANEPYDRWVRALLTADEPGAETYYVQFRNKPEDLTESYSRTFLGTQLQCARCHDHPFTSVTQKDFFGMAGFFVRLVVLDQPSEGSGEKQVKRFTVGEKASGDVLFAGNVKEAVPGKKGEPIRPKFLGGAALDEPPLPKDFKEPEPKSGARSMPKPAFSRKEKLAEWTTRPTNPFFARAAANRFWAQFMGRGIVQPIDGMGDDNPPAIPALLDELTRQFVARKFDTKWLTREIVSSQTYQLASTGPGAASLPPRWERARVRPLSAEEMQAAITVAGGDPAAKAGGTDTSDYFLRYFGEPINGAGEFQGGLTEHLFLNYSDNVRALIRRKKGNLADAILTSTDPWERRVDRLFLSVLTRPPTAAERDRFTAHLTGDPKAEGAVEEAIWVLMNTSEFRFNH